jgi:ABC-type nickel/cobalt efflux system permease component RcnA
MKQIGTGLLLMIVGVLMVLDVLNVLSLSNWFEYMWALLVFLIGFEILLSAQRKATKRKIEKRINKEKVKLEKELEEKHAEDTKNLEIELKKKELVMEEQEEVIDDMINPKI